MKSTNFIPETLHECSCRGRIGDVMLPVDPYLINHLTLEPLRSMTISKTSAIGGYLEQFGQVNIFKNARTALRIVVDHHKKNTDHVEISTTTQSNYLSSCVTDAIGDTKRGFSNPNSTKIFISDFGVIENTLLMQSNIWDDAWSFSGSQIKAYFRASGEHYITSLPKILGAPYGGLLISKDRNADFSGFEALKVSDPIYQVADHELSNFESVREKREENSKLIYSFLEKYSWTRFFIDSAFGVVVAKPPLPFDERKFKYFLQIHGIRGTSFFGNQAVILPNHQFLNRDDIKYIGEIAKHCYELAVKR